LGLLLERVYQALHNQKKRKITIDAISVERLNDGDMNLSPIAKQGGY
jgi:hypothetical protein